MSKLTRTLIIGATLAAMHLAGMTAVAQAQANDEPVRQPPTERQVGESWRHRQAAAKEQTAADAALQRVQAPERSAIPNATPAPVPPEPSGQPNWLVASLGGFAAGLALAGGLAMLAARRAGRITHPSARHQPLQTDPESNRTTPQPPRAPPRAPPARAVPRRHRTGPGSATVRDHEIAARDRPLGHLLD
jgi:hypothetical protein